MGLQRFHLLEDVARLEHWDSGFLKGHVGAAVEVRAAATDCFDELLGTDDPGNSPAGEAETLGEAINEENVVFVNVDDVVGGGNAGAVAIASIIVARVEFVHNQCSTVTAYILDFGELGVLHDLPCGVAGVAG